MVRERASPRAPVTGADLNAGMIETARRLTADAPEAFRWHVADAAALPVPDGAFTLVLCQQGFQFLPDGPAALGEARRVLRPGGRLALSVWKEASPFFLALAEALARHVSPEAARRSLAPFAFPDLDRLPLMLEAAGFRDPETRDLTVERVLRDPATAIPGEILGNPVGPEVAARGEAVMERIVADVIAACAGLFRGPDLVSPQTARLVVARRG